MTPPWRYRLLIRALSPLLAGYTLWRALKDGGRRYWWQRLGIYSTSLTAELSPPEQDVKLWVHAASVGEVLTVLPLIREWQQHTGDKVLLTTGTPTGAAVLAKQALPDIQHQYLPIDFPGACRRFLEQLPAGRGWIVETEIWPWLYSHCERTGVALTIINGRLSSRTSKQSDGLLASSYRRALSPVRVLARSQQDVDNFIALGTPAAQVELIGNLKYTQSTDTPVDTPLIPGRYVLAASTHADEEVQLAGSWLKQAVKDELLVIVPRHPERGSAILRDLRALGAGVSQRSAGQQPASGDQIYLADTLGELQAWYSFASACFVGGSLITRGGHNMLEPARYSCPIVVGPHTGNFDDIMQLMRNSNAIDIAQSSDEAIRFLCEAAQGQARHRDMAARALQVSEDSQNVLQRYMTALS
ncbi:3-deoxy-D-manno-octulosonic acid transferase [Granulosicoccus antarcticus]|uniref:3-deoxy-D-manno-octulosonic acid transferase n=1 Tax=Granulosicoccus antarcticus IMCC3135 TaxID=1192854 RepID=A0A2Z2NRW0_9GAMM|nr:glycosyltransferase N-terminal domain-containing protein [Granulosicoccus antarcticus]ASJ71480.1 3-deoxy-D-manno-octulosonic acid transferase [Granulosicoccus antarcticus IMCC3135]